MRTSRVYRVSAVVIRRRELGEADRILVLYTRERGKLSAVAKGVKRPRSKLAASLQLFTHAQLQLAAGRTLEVVTQARVVDTFYNLRKDMARYAHASYAAELLDTVTEEGLADPPLFELLLGTLSALDTGGEPTTLIRALELKLLGRLGYGPELTSCSSCGAGLGQGARGFSVSQGGVVCGRCLAATSGAVPLSAAAARALRELLELATQELAVKRMNEQTRREVNRLMGAYLPFHLGRELHSAAFLTSTGDT